MRRLIVIEYVSLDGVIQAPGHATEDSEGGFAHGGWGWTDRFMVEHGRYNAETFQTAGAFLLGRLTYQIWADYWPSVTDQSDEVARALNTLPKYVASTTLTEALWSGTTIIGSDIATQVATLKKQPGKPILVIGSSKLAQTLLQHDLVDEYELWLHPVVLGSGKRLFQDGGPMKTLQLVDSKTTASGLVILTYEPAGPPCRRAAA
jgi:dihydrofolate reductase